MMSCMSRRTCLTALTATVALAMLLAGCGGEYQRSSAPTATPATPATATPVPTPPLPTATAAPDSTPTPDERDFPAPVVLAREAAANDAGVAVDAVAVVEYEAVVWPSTALGCPLPGMFYAQVMTPGYRVTLEVGGVRHAYHTDTGTQIVRCGP
jgi:hypothetical protein